MTILDSLAIFFLKYTNDNEAPLIIFYTISFNGLFLSEGAVA